MTGLWALIRRDIKLYFKDKGMFFSSLITPIILLVLYATFLRSIYADSFRSALGAAEALVSDALVNGCVGGQLVSSLLAVCCVTVAFCSNLLMIKDKTTGARGDLTVAPVRPGALGLGYYLASLFSTLIVTVCATAVCFGYLAATGWYLSAGDVLLVLLDVFLVTMFGTALSSCINFFLTTDGQASAVGTIVSAGYGFVCGAYMPISSFGSGLQKKLSFLPGTYGTALLRNHMMRGVFAEMNAQGFPAAAIDAIRDGMDCNLRFFGAAVSQSAMYGVLCGSVLALIGIYVAINMLKRN